CVRHDHFARNITQQTATRDDDDRKALDQLHDELRPDNDQRNAHYQTEHDQQRAAFRSAGNADNVVYTHYQIGDDNRAYRHHETVGSLHLVTIAVFIRDELDADPHQQDGADQIEIRKLEETDREERQ